MPVHAKGRHDFIFDQTAVIMRRRVAWRYLDDGAIHIAVVPRAHEKRPGFYSLMAVKTAIAGKDRQAVEIYPKHNDLVDDKNRSATHLWVLPIGHELPYTLPKQEGGKHGIRS